MASVRLQPVEEDSHDDQHSGKDSGRNSKIVQGHANIKRKITLNFGQENIRADKSELLIEQPSRHPAINVSEIHLEEVENSQPKLKEKMPKNKSSIHLNLEPVKAPGFKRLADDDFDSESQEQNGRLGQQEETVMRSHSDNVEIRIPNLNVRVATDKKQEDKQDDV